MGVFTIQQRHSPYLNIRSHKMDQSTIYFLIVAKVVGAPIIAAGLFFGGCQYSARKHSGRIREAANKLLADPTVKTL